MSAAEKYGVSDNVRWCGALYGDDQVAPWFLSAAAFVFPGPIGLSLLHAFAYGLPVVTHGDPAFHGPEFLALRSGWSGLVFRRGDAHDLAAKLQLLLEDTPMRLEIHQNALKTVRENYSLEAMIDRFVRAVQRASALSMGQPAEVSRNARATVTATTRNPREDAERE